MKIHGHKEGNDGHWGLFEGLRVEGERTEKRRKKILGTKAYYLGDKIICTKTPRDTSLPT